MRAPQDVPWAGDCGDNSCMYSHRKGGMGTNGGCRCLEKWASSASLAELQAALNSEHMPPSGKSTLRWYVKHGKKE